MFASTGQNKTTVRIHLLRMGLVAVLLFFCLFGPAACLAAERVDETRLVKIDLDSTVLNKRMQILVWLPEAIEADQAYPVLYFLPDGGGSAHTVINDYQIGEAADEQVRQGVIGPMIIVAVSMDRSFGLNSAAAVSPVDTAGGQSFVEGPYEAYFIDEVMPLIEARFQTKNDRSGRMIGGYSMGGYAALHLAFRHPQLFCRVGGHSASLFPEAFPDESISDWLYPDEQIRDQRDPIRLAETCDLTGLQVYLDTGATDVNVEGNALLAQILEEKGISCEKHVFPGTHSRFYCTTMMPEYLAFYGAPYTP
jgi:enterochelin esterase-like enzyme